MRDLGDIQKNIELAQNGQFKVCIWGAGFLGRTVGYDTLKKVNITPDYYCDNNEELWGKDIIDGIKCMNYQLLLKEKEEIIWFICIHFTKINEVVNQLQDLGECKFVTLPELIGIPGMTHKFFDFMNRKTVAYTCIVGNYDSLLEPGEEIREQYDYYLISDKEPQHDSVYKWIDIKDIVPNSVSDFTKMNRYCKINAHKIFPTYKKSIYHDGNISLKHNLDNYFDMLKKTRIGAASPLQWDIYEEAARLLPQMRDQPERIYSQMEKYWTEGMPEKFGSCWCNVLIREHNNPTCVKLMEDWWNEVESQSKRDQLSFPYVLWKNNYSMEDILMISEDSSKCLHWEYVHEHNVSRLSNVK